MACSMGTSVGYDRARNKVSGGPMAYPLAHCQLESRFQSDTFVSTLNCYGRGRVGVESPIISVPPRGENSLHPLY